MSRAKEILKMVEADGSVIKKVQKAIKGKFVEGPSGQVGVQVKVSRGWLPAPGKVNIGTSRDMSVADREKHVLDRVKKVLSAHKDATYIDISYGTGEKFDSKKIRIEL
jgi:hypothetical protein